MHIKDDHTDLYQNYKTSDEANEAAVDDFLKIATSQSEQQSGWQAVNWAQFAQRHMKIKKKIDDLKLVRPNKVFIKNNRSVIQRRQRMVHDQEHSPSSTGTTDSSASNSATKENGLPEHSQEKAEENDDDDQSTLIDVETVSENAPVRVSVIVENPNRIT